MFSKSDLLLQELSWGQADLLSYNTVQCFLCSINVLISHPEKDYKDKEPVSPNCTSMVHTGIIFETTAATRVVIKVNDIPFKYVQLQLFPLEVLTTNGYTSYYVKWVTKRIAVTSKLCLYFKKCHSCVELWVQAAMQSILLGMNVDGKNSTTEVCQKIPPEPRNYLCGAPF